jgi:hypothetical protein
MSDTTTKACAWCGAPATEALKDERRTRLGSGTVVKAGPGTSLPVCEACGDRLERRYSVARGYKAA